MKRATEDISCLAGSSVFQGLVDRAETNMNRLACLVLPELWL